MAAALMGLLPVAMFLAALVFLDSYKLVRPRIVAVVVACGMAMAALSYVLNGWALSILPIDFTTFTRYVAPPLEEALKALVIVALIRMHRIGFLVDAAIFGFAVGTGFAMVENFQYLLLVPDAGMGTWLVRGVGTAVMHGGATALFAVYALSVMPGASASGKPSTLRTAVRFLPGFALAVVLHSAYNHFFLSPFLSTVGIVVALPLLMNLVFTRGEAAVGDWLGEGFDADAEMLELVSSGRLSDSTIGQYIHELKEKFEGPVVGDLLCYLRIYTELALRAKGILMMRENGFEVSIDEATRERFEELRYLQKSIGRTGLRAIQPMLHMSHKDLWQLYMLEK